MQRAKTTLDQSYNSPAAATKKAKARNQKKKLNDFSGQRRSSSLKPVDFHSQHLLIKDQQN
jgi:hypothetical protein